MKSLLFCIKNTEQINLLNNKTTSNEDLNILIKSINNATIALWLPGATNEDIDGDINLSKIYRLKFYQQSYNGIENIKKQLLNNIIHFKYKKKKLKNTIKNYWI